MSQNLLMGHSYVFNLLHPSKQLFLTYQKIQSILEIIMEAVGKHIRYLRKERAWSLEQLSQRTGLSVSFISQVERSQTSVSISSLKVIADALEEPIQNFFPVPEEISSIVHIGDVKWLQFEDSIHYGLLSNPLKAKNLEALLVEYPPHYKGPPPFSHDGEEFGYILEGTLTLIVQNKTYELKKGESFHIISQVPHTEKNTGDVPVKILYVTTPPIIGRTALSSGNKG